MIEHCVSFFRKKQEDRLFRMYITDAMRLITYNTSQRGSGAIEQRYIDLIQNMKKKEETRTSEEVIGSIKDKLRKMGGG